MRQYRAFIKVFAAALAIVVWFLFCAGAANAKGTVVIHHYTGRVNTYREVSIKVLHGALFVTTKDGKGTLVIHRAACSYQGKLLVCFATSATLVQSGHTTPLDLKTGTVYLNDTNEPQPLVLSATRVPPHSVLLSLTTDRGTYVSLNGRMDQVVR